MSELPFRFTSDGELFDALFAGIPAEELPARKKKLRVLAVCIVALLIGGVGAVRVVDGEEQAVPALSTIAMEAPAAPWA